LSRNNWKFQHQERVADFDLDIDFFKFRPSDSKIIRFWQNDPLADLGHEISTYVGFFNNPNTFFDPDGRWPDTYLTPGEEWMKKNGLLEESRKNPDLQRGLTQLYAKTPQGANAHYDISYTNGYLNFFEEQTKDFFGVGYDQYWYRKGRMFIGASSSDVAWGGVHGTMDMLGSVPLLGEGFDLINAGLYSSRGMAKEASTSLLYMVAFAEVLKYFKYIEWPKQLHHFASNKHKTYTQQFDNIASQYGLDLDASWNKVSMHHLGRHPDDYHEFVLLGMQKAASEAGGNKQAFLKKYYKYVIDPVRDNPNMLRKNYYK
jgi:hypothetical protein